MAFVVVHPAAAAADISTVRLDNMRPPLSSAQLDRASSGAHLLIRWETRAGTLA
jgi:hypothetical protein